MTVTLEKPEIISLMYRQEKTDADYGSCLWARFCLDLKNYTMSIESDCGNYSYGWYPTPDTESFLKLCSRFDKWYLLYKMSSESVIDGEKTFQAVKEVINNYLEYYDLELDEFDWKDIESACLHGFNEYDVAESISATLGGTELYGKFEEESIWSAIEKDYPPNAKKIFSVFVDCIQPFIKKMEVDNG